MCRSCVPGLSCSPAYCAKYMRWKIRQQTALRKLHQTEEERELYEDALQHVQYEKALADQKQNKSSTKRQDHHHLQSPFPPGTKIKCTHKEAEIPSTLHHPPAAWNEETSQSTLKELCIHLVNLAKVKNGGVTPQTAEAVRICKDAALMFEHLAPPYVKILGTINASGRESVVKRRRSSLLLREMNLCPTQEDYQKQEPDHDQIPLLL